MIIKRILKKIIPCLLILTALFLVGCTASDDKPTTPAVTDAGTDSGSKETTGGGTASGVGLDAIKAAGVLNVGVKSDVPKFSMVNTATNEYEGFEDDLAYEIAGKIFGVTADEAKSQKLVAFQGVTAKTRGPLLDNGTIDLVIATFTITEERKESYNFSDAYFTDAVRFLVKTDKGFTSLKDLDGQTIGVSQSSTTKTNIDAYIADKGLGIACKYSEFASYPELKAALDSGRIQAFSVDGAILAGYNDDTTTFLPESFAPQEYGVASAITKTDLADLVNVVVNDLKSTGEIDNMLVKWGIE